MVVFVVIRLAGDLAVVSSRVSEAHIGVNSIAELRLSPRSPLGTSVLPAHSW